MNNKTYVLDTETTGLSHESGDRIIEIGIVEMENRRPTGRKFHEYVDPEREVHEEALAVHGWSREDLVAAGNGQKFHHIAQKMIDFIGGGELIIHNAPFDMGFLDFELKKIGMPTLSSQCKVFDTLKYANIKYPGRRNNLDAICRRLGIDNSNRTFHGALLDAEILSEVYITMTQNQNALELSTDTNKNIVLKPALQFERVTSPEAMKLPIIEASDSESIQHEVVMKRLDKESRGNTLWR